MNIEFKYLKSNSNSKILLLIPSSAGNVLFYKFRRNFFLDNGYSILYYNPRNHGKSEGTFDWSDAVNDLKQILDRENLNEIPVIGFAHSSGCSVLLHLINSGLEISSCFMVSPVLKSKDSILSLYKNQAINQFLDPAMYVFQCKKESLETVFKNTNWLELDFWEKNNIEKILNDSTDYKKKEGFLFGKYIKNLFIPGVNTSGVLEKVKGKVDFFLPAIDPWISRVELLELAKKNQIFVHQVDQAKDHYFKNSWNIVWNIIENRVVNL